MMLTGSRTWSLKDILRDVLRDVLLCLSITLFHGAHGSSPPPPDILGPISPDTHSQRIPNAFLDHKPWRIHATFAVSYKYCGAGGLRIRIFTEVMIYIDLQPLSSG